MYIKKDTCPVCGSMDIKNFIICKDHFLSGESFAINECNECTFRFTNPRPLDSELEKYYDSENYISHTIQSKNLIHFIYKIIRSYTLKQKLKLINSLSENKHILDVGCGTGEFLNVCKQNGWNSTGVEVNEKARKSARQKFNLTLHENLFELKTEGVFNIITLWHVFEHLPDIHKTLAHLKSLLNTKGYLVMALPNHKSYDAIKYESDWAGYDVPRHLSHFNQKSLKTLAKMHDLKLKNVLPMKMDAFYISLLSEKYRTNRNRYFNSFITGLKSNSYAKNNHLEYSSLIYILKK